MTKLFTCTGTAAAVTRYSAGDVVREVFQYSHVVRAETDMEAEDKLIGFYSDKRDGITTFEVDTVAIWDMIE